MWELLQPSSRGGLSSRRIFAYALAAFTAALLWTLIVTTGAHATDATWKNGAIEYGSNSYSGPAPAATVKDLGFRDGTPSYTYVDPSSSNPPRQIHVIYFASNTDPNVATSAKYRTYIYQGPGNYTDPSNPTDISISNQSSSSSATTAGAGTTSCAVEGGLGWIICPVTNFLASGMDWVFKILSGFLAVRPVETGQNNALFRAWSYMLSFANIAFVIAFLIIIYSQLTNFGIDNYGIKKLLPRLIIAAVLVNVSYYISSIAVDLSNILGYSIQDIFIQIRNTLVGPEGNSWNTTSWQSMGSFILSGGTLATAGVIGLTATLSTYGVGGAIILLLPSLVAGLVAVLVALVIMAARQAIVTILIILAPLAFVAYLLPNTEKWFEKWRSTFVTMLILFPAFSVVFGGSQLAAAAIIQNADSINLVILGMLVQVAPLFITPMLIRLSGSMLGKIAGMVNNPSKGMVDRTKNWSKEKADDIKAKRLATTAGRGAFLKRNAQRVDHNRLKRERQRKIHEGMSANRYAGSFDGAQQYEAEHGIETAKKTIEERLSRDISMKIQLDPTMMAREMKMRLTTDQSSTAKAQLDTVHENLLAGKFNANPNSSIGKILASLTDESSLASRDLALAAIASQTAKRVQQNNLSDALQVNDQTVGINGQKLRTYAGGIEGLKGESSALAYAVSVEKKAIADLVSERTILSKQFNLTYGQMQNLAEGKSSEVGTVTRDDGTVIKYTFDVDDQYNLRAAMEQQLKIGTYDDRTEIILATAKPGSKTAKFKQIASESIPANKMDELGVFFGGQSIGDVEAGSIRNKADMVEIATRYIDQGKFNASKLSTNDPNAISILLEAAATKQPYKGGDGKYKTVSADFDKNVAALKKVAKSILDGDTTAGENATQATRAALEKLIK